jgi:hypothetical protein
MDPALAHALVGQPLDVLEQQEPRLEIVHGQLFLAETMQLAPAFWTHKFLEPSLKPAIANHRFSSWR